MRKILGWTLTEEELFWDYRKNDPRELGEDGLPVENDERVEAHLTEVEETVTLRPRKTSIVVENYDWFEA